MMMSALTGFSGGSTTMGALFSTLAQVIARPIMWKNGATVGMGTSGWNNAICVLRRPSGTGRFRN